MVIIACHLLKRSPPVNIPSQYHPCMPQIVAEGNTNMALASFPRSIFIIMGVCLLQIPSSSVVDNGIVSAQQMYSDDYSEDCDNHHSRSSAYECNGAAEECQTFVLYRAQPFYMSLLNISMLFNMNPTVIASASNLSVTAYSKPLAKDHAVLIPINCSCSGDLSQANVTYIVLPNDTYMNIANQTFEGLTTCQAMRAQNRYAPDDLAAGEVLIAPLRCACPTDTQVSMGVKYLLSYIVDVDDDDDIITAKFNILHQDFIYANELDPVNPTIYPYTTLLIPLNHTPVVPRLGPFRLNHTIATTNGKRISTKVKAGKSLILKSYRCVQFLIFCIQSWINLVKIISRDIVYSMFRA